MCWLHFICWRHLLGSGISMSVCSCFGLFRIHTVSWMVRNSSACRGLQAQRHKSVPRARFVRRFRVLCCCYRYRRADTIAIASAATTQFLRLLPLPLLSDIANPVSQAFCLSSAVSAQAVNNRRIDETANPLKTAISPNPKCQDPR